MSQKFHLKSKKKTRAMPVGGRVKVLTAGGVCTFPALSGKHCSVESKVKARVAGSNLGLVDWWDW